ncbi:acyl-CoA dehydrogenase [Achromobacter xylosoxidans]|jgi:alkylation response protein AidB-like acyl-CoA dehydrogenase|uniref:3-methylmercaptopropionyl-CoA dehydrogenase n=1 Tax=Achromobacter spanius TaxID=217203 RepID=A0A2S5GNQ2_9BURK|nr:MULTISPECIES: acyl-CoA dehydrogenase [Achromobacter]MDD7991176.1 acyl-CoA dehydrogenase [Achromobacter xylosoxidans]MDQ6211620.1 acyl-CoA dehydrogenase [Achromobacter insolitus]MDZ5613324.1 acyl-CoA dehydrogenase [Achromobacter xylosoxidans]MDZ5624570.1 acyl-CoA dehydrogenase [Achromobacter xylosoxidans]MDZ5684836.1 acyl-CoA dehydrogenase [Achromobacter xylosoxidans]
MSHYTPPLQDMQFVLDELVDLHEIAALPGYGEATPDLARAVLEEAGVFASEVIAPLNHSGDIEGVRLEGGQPRMPAGWAQAYARFVEAGWPALSAPEEQGGQNLPGVLAAAVEEMWNSGSVAFGLLSLLSRGAVNVLRHAGSPELQQQYLPRMVSGEWTGTMVLTEPQAGSDLSAVRTRATRQTDGSYRLHGTKIFITYGDHDLVPNVVHLVLARVEGAPAGTKGISLFAVPKVLVNDDGSLGEPNDVRAVSIERKLGLHATPTCVMAFGDGAGAVGYLVGEENRGLEYMFIMMNSARFAVGLEGIGLAERAYQKARAYARERVQGVEQGGDTGAKVAIIRHPDVRRMLLSMKSRIEAMRALAAVMAASMDQAALNPDPEVRDAHQAFVELMMPIAKGWFTETGLDIASMGIQVHGGVGFIEETGAAQYFRDARITTIYEGTTGIQAMDLVGRKIGRDGGRAIGAVIVRMRQVQVDLESHARAGLHVIGAQLKKGIGDLEAAVESLVKSCEGGPKPALAGSGPLLELLGIVAAGWQMGRAALAADRLLASDPGSDFLSSKILTCRFYADHILSKSAGLRHAIVSGSDAILDFSEAAF